jgi:hypothetical protein
VCENVFVTKWVPVTYKIPEHSHNKQMFSYFKHAKHSIMNVIKSDNDFKLMPSSVRGAARDRMIVVTETIQQRKQLIWTKYI